MKKFKTGFTIVELIIVIAVIGVLAAILIPAFSNVIYKANTKNDISACRNMNTALLASNDSASANKVDFVDACSALVNAGYPVGLIMPKIEGAQFCFDTELGKVLYIDKEAQKATFPSEHSGRTALDAATNGGTWIPFIKPFENISNENGMTMEADYSAMGDTVISLRHAQDYTLDLGGKTLNLNGRRLVIVGDTTGTVTFTNGNIENGQVFVNIPNGDVEFEANAYESVNWTIMAVCENTMTVQTGAKIDGAISLLRGHIRVASGATVSNISIPENVKGESKVTIDMGGKVIAMRVASSAFSKVHIINQGMVNYVAGSVSVGTNQDGTSAHNVTGDMFHFFGGEGTQANPFLIGSAEQFNRLYYELSKNPTGGLHFKLINNIDFTGKVLNNNEVCSIYPSFVFDGNGFALRGVARFEKYTQVFPYIQNTTLKNFDIHFAGTKASISYGTQETNLFENVDAFGKVEFATGPMSSVYVNYPSSGTNLTFKNCDNYTNVSGVAASYSTAFVSHAGAGNLTITFDNCQNFGTMTGGYASGFAGMVNSSTIKFVGTNRNFGNLYYMTNYGLFASGTKNYDANIINTGNIGKISTFAIQAPANYGDVLVIPAQPGAAKYQVTVLYGTQMYNYPGAGNSWSGYFPHSFTRTYNAPESGSLTTEFKKLYVAEENQTKYDYQNRTAVPYTGVFAPSGFSYNPDKVVQTHSGKNFYFEPACSDNYHGLLTSTQINDPNSLYTVTMSVLVYDAAGNLISSGTTSYSYTVQEARDYLGQS